MKRPPVLTWPLVAVQIFHCCSENPRNSFCVVTCKLNDKLKFVFSFYFRLLFMRAYFAFAILLTKKVLSLFDRTGRRMEAMAGTTRCRCRAVPSYKTCSRAQVGIVAAMGGTNNTTTAETTDVTINGMTADISSRFVLLFYILLLGDS